jgi:uncharacterized protein (DUF433 family)
MQKRIVLDPQIRHGQPAIKGTRVPVATVVGSVAGGMSFDEICAEYDLTREDILAALEFAAAMDDESDFSLVVPRSGKTK